MHETWIALIPAYEPDEKLSSIVKDLFERGFEVVVVNDGSAAEKNPLFEEVSLYAALLTHEKNRGKGAALKTGLQYIREKYRDDYIVVTVDADGQHAVEDVVRVCEKAQANPGHLVLGSRSWYQGNRNADGDERVRDQESTDPDQENEVKVRESEAQDQGKKIPLRSRFGNGLTKFVFRLTTGLKVSDTQTGLRAFSSSLVDPFLQIEGDRYEYEMNMLLECSRKKIPVDEVSIRTIYLNGNSSSHFNAVKDSIRIYKEILKFSASSFLGFLVDYGMFAVLSAVTGALGMSASAGVVFSNIGARVVSSFVNFTVNRKYVFHSQSNVWTAAAQYFSLAACILAGNTFLLNFLVNTAGVNRYAAKIITEIIFFTFSWLVQKFVIFRKKNSCPDRAALPDQMTE